MCFALVGTISEHAAREHRYATVAGGARGQCPTGLDEVNDTVPAEEIASATRVDEEVLAVANRAGRRVGDVVKGVVARL